MGILPFSLFLCVGLSLGSLFALPADGKLIHDWGGSYRRYLPPPNTMPSGGRSLMRSCCLRMNYGDYRPTISPFVFFPYSGRAGAAVALFYLR